MKDIGRIEEMAAEIVPALERELGTLDADFGDVPPELRLRVKGGCIVTSETLRQKCVNEGFGAGIMERRLPEPLEGRHALLVIEGDGGPVVLDGTYGQLFEPFGPSWAEAAAGRPVRFPEQRVLAFPAGEEDTVAEWATEIAAMANPGVDREAAYDYFRSMWDLRFYRGYTAPYPTRNFADRLNRALRSRP